MSQQRQFQRRRRGSLFGPLLLIILGIIFLLNNVNVLRGDVWNTILRLWPVILIVIGLDSLYQRQGLVGAIFLIGLGTLFLLANLNILNLDVWQMALHLWPVLLVAIGLDLIVGRRSLWASLAGLVVLLAVLAGALWFYGVRLESGQALPGHEVRQALDGVKSAEIILESGAGDVSIHALSGSTDLVAGQVASGSGRQTVEDFSMQGDQAIFRMRETGNYGAIWERAGQYTWDLGLNSAIPLKIQFNQGAGSSTLNLNGLQLDALKVNMGVGQIKVTLPATGQFDAGIDGAIGQVILIVPAGMELRVQSDLALANLVVPAGYQKSDKVYTSPGYASAENRVNLEIGLAIGNVTIQEK